MKFFFVWDHRHKYRYFSSKPIVQIQIKFSHWKEIWEKAKKILMLLFPRTLSQAQAFAKALKLEEDEVRIFHSGRLEQKKIKNKLYFFLQKQRTKHIFLLIGETLLLPLSGLAAILPGPNIFFGMLALLMITHWQALRGINRMLRKNYRFISDPLLEEWEKAVKLKKEEYFPQILDKIAKKYNISNIHKLLWK